MSEKYDHHKIEQKWQKHWDETKAFAATENSQKKKSYLLVEFPYPSGEGLHTGHVRSYTAMDVIARKRRAQGQEVLYPIGWDAFGLPTENYAIKTGIPPAEVTKKNTDTFRRQLKNLGLSFDWDREVNTTDPAYYKWTQWIFLQLYKKGLAYKAKTTINWCPKDKIGLANEEVVDGKCERCGNPVEKREKEQWMLAITKYAQRLYDDLDLVDYIERAKVQQRNWIGPSEGARIDFALHFVYKPDANENRGPNGEKAKITVFTTRPDTLFGATYMVLAPEHPWVMLALDDQHDVLENKDEVRAYVASVKDKTEIDRTAEGKEKTGVELKGVKAINPANGEEIPIFVADYVLGSYGTGAIMAVPAHDDRDFAFAKKFNVPIKQVIVPCTIDANNPPRAGWEEVKRDTAVVHLRNKATGTFALLNWHGSLEGITTAIMGGVEPGQTPEEAALAEISEEAAISGAKIIKTAPWVTAARYSASHKNQNRCAHAWAFLAEIENLEVQGEIPANEQALHTLVWVDESEVAARLTPQHQKLMWHLLHHEEPLTGDGYLINSGQFDGMDSEQAKKKITECVGGEWVTTFKLRDWVFSRQRYWGEPIPMIRCQKDGWVPVPEDQLPVTLPVVEKYQPTDTGESPLATIMEFVETTCPTCGGPAKRETDVMPNWAGSSWYFLRYCDPRNAEEFASMLKLQYWLDSNLPRSSSQSGGGVDWYNGGMEHTVLHLLYSRFWHKFLFDIGLVPTSEPYAKRTSHGLILAGDGTKMSKSKGNVVNPDELVNTMGADSLRLYEMFMGPFEQAIAWSTDGVVGARRFLERVWQMHEKVAAVTMTPETEVLVHQTIRKVTEDIEALKMNTAVSALMILSNHLHELEKVPSEAYAALIGLLNPFVPHFSAELAERKGVSLATWPQFDAQKAEPKSVVVAVQVNGKVRGSVSLSPQASETEALDAARRDPAVAKWLAQGKEKKAVYVSGRIINFVLDRQ